MQKNKLAEKWLKSSKVSSSDKKLIRKMSLEQIKTFFDDSLMCFGTAGIRSTMGPGTKQLNKFTYIQITAAYAEYIIKHFKNPFIVIGHDNRKNSAAYAKLCAEVLSSYRIKALLFNNNQLMPTPIISYTIRKIKASGGIIITASHNPKEYNGFKVYNPDGSQILPKVADEITSYMAKPSSILNLKYKPKKSYISYVPNKYVSSYLLEARSAIIDKSILEEKRSFPVIFTGHHGTSCKLWPRFIKSLGWKVIPVKEQCFTNSSFTNSPVSNPEAPESFNLAIKYAKKHHAKIAIGVDPDADRMAIAIFHNGSWRFMSGNDMGTIYVWYILNNKKFAKQPYIIASTVSTDLIDKIAKEHNAKVYRTGTGFKWMGNLTTKIGNKEDFVVAFEESIGACNTKIDRDKDSFTAAALALEIYSKYQKKGMDFIDILEKIIYPKFGYWFGQTQNFCYFGILDWKPVVDKKMEMLKNFKLQNIGPYKLTKIKWNDVGGCLEWFLTNDSWIRFRVSGTEPKLKAYYNLYAPNPRKLDVCINQVKEFISKLLK